MASGPSAIVPGRKCGACSLCCKLLDVDALSKPRGTWCQHCKAPQGCAIYEQRPSDCRSFHCVWLTTPEVGDEWHPLRSKMVPYLDEGGKQLAVYVDPAFPLAWRNEPYLSQLRQWASNGAKSGGRVFVFVKNSLTVILPTKEVELGKFELGDEVIVSETRTALGSDYQVRKVSSGAV